MGIWSLHPSYLDSKGLVALWRETLLAKHVLEGKTTGYKNHPQLNRFKACPEPLSALNRYLMLVFDESIQRGFNFDKSKFKMNSFEQVLTLTQGQLDYEWSHLLSKLKVRDIDRYQSIKDQTNIKAIPLFKIVPGPIESWEIILESS